MELEPSQAEHLHALEMQEELHKKALADLRITLEEQHQQDAEESRASANKEVEALEEELEDKNRQQRQLMERLQSFQREHEATLEAHQKELASLEVRHVNSCAVCSGRCETILPFPCVAALWANSL